MYEDVNVNVECEDVRLIVSGVSGGVGQIKLGWADRRALEGGGEGGRREERS